MGLGSRLGRGFSGTLRRLTPLIYSTTALAIWTACNAPEAGKLLGRDEESGPAAYVPGNSGGTSGDGADNSPSGGGGNTGGTTNPSGPRVIGDSCQSSDPNKICLALKYVVYQDGKGQPVVTQNQAIQNVKNINQVWSQCNLGFQIEAYLSINPVDYELNYRTANYGELDDIRNTLGDDNTLLVVTTGPWNRSGSLGNTGANAWTSVPGGPPYGAVLEAPVGTFSNIIAHELGHYLNLMHVNDTADLLNPIIYSNSTKLTQGQCSTARSAANYYWDDSLR